MAERIETVIVGGGQAGLATSYLLQQRGREHIVLEQADRPGYAWREQRWDSFTWVTPNWMIKLPGMEYAGDDPDGFMVRADIVAMFEQYVERYGLPVRFGVRVLSVEPMGTGYRVETDQGDYEAANVVVATGMYQKARVPAWAASLPPDIRQVRVDEYRNPHSLPPGAVLVVGSGQSGCQITEELIENGRKVYLCVGRGGRIPRRYRGKDSLYWADVVGLFDRTVDKLESPKEKFDANPQVTGKDGGHSINLHQFARDGVTLLGRLQGVRDGKLILAPDLKENLAKIDQFEEEFCKLVDATIEQLGLSAPPETLPKLTDGYEQPEILELDIREAGISTVIWAAGFAFDYSLVKLPVLDEDGYPVQKRGVTDYPGLYFIGMAWLYKPKSPLEFGVGEDAAYIVEHIAGRA